MTQNLVLVNQAVDWASVFVALGLLFVTLAYTYFTASQVQPHLQASIDFNKSERMFFIVHNIGKGAARDIEASWFVRSPESECREWRTTLIPADERHRFAIPLGPRGKRLTNVGEIGNNLGDGKGIIEFHAECNDVLGCNHYFSQTVSIRENLLRMDKAEELPEGDKMDELNEYIFDIKKEIERISSSD